MVFRKYQHDYLLDKAHRLILVVADLLSAPVDIIVSPSNGGLAPGGGLALQVIQEAGSDTEVACERYFQDHGKIPTSENAVTTAGRLPFKAIIHAVGPRMVEDDVESKLTRTFEHCLDTAEQLGCRSIALPAISTGIFGVPRPICAASCYQAVSRYWTSHPDSNLTTVWLCVTVDAYEEFEKAMNGLIHDESVSAHLSEDDPMDEVGEFMVDELDLSEEGIPEAWLTPNRE